MPNIKGHVLQNAMASCNSHPGHGLLVVVVVLISRDTHEGRKKWEADSAALGSMTHTQLTNCKHKIRDGEEQFYKHNFSKFLNTAVV